MSQTPLESATTTAATQRYKAGFSRIREQYFESGDPILALEARTKLVDSIVGEAFREFLTPVWPTGLAAITVGGYG